ncbi:MAG: DUF2752 domain-containing protein [Oligoflexia bacterium]|nr:DUF2752 domain-containing protein [Oligoflexia bacterium]
MKRLIKILFGFLYSLILINIFFKYFFPVVHTQLSPLKIIFTSFSNFIYQFQLPPIPDLCLFHLLTHLQCPGCGMTRAILSIINGDISQAFYYNPFFILLFIYGLFWVLSSRLYLYYQYFLFNRYFNIFLLIIIISFTIARNFVVANPLPLSSSFPSPSSAVGIRMDEGIYQFYPKGCYLESKNSQELVKKHDQTLSLLLAIEALDFAFKNSIILQKGKNNISPAKILFVKQIADLSKTLRAKNENLITLDEANVTKEFEDFDNDNSKESAMGIFYLQLLIKKLTVVNKKISTHINYFQKMIDLISLNTLTSTSCQHQLNQVTHDQTDLFNKYLRTIKIKAQIKKSAEEMANNISSIDCLASMLKEKLELSQKILSGSKDVFSGMISCHQTDIRRRKEMGKGAVVFNWSPSKTKILRGGGIMSKDKNIFDRITTITQNYLYLKTATTNKNKSPGLY